jgi:hypothetical protein
MLAAWMLSAVMPLAVRAEGRLQSRLREAQLAAEFEPQESGQTSQPASSDAQATAGTPAPADSCNCRRIRSGDQLWLVSTRGLGCAGCGDEDPALEFFRYDASACWQRATLHDFLTADDPRIPTDFYVHGNSMSADEAREQGMTVYHRLVACAPGDRPIRMVIWSWPTDRGRHPLRLLREHACRADTDAWYLGWLISRMDRRDKIGLLGFSFGTRVVTGAMHLLGGGELCGKQLPGEDSKQATDSAPRPAVRAALLAAAEDSDWLRPGAPNGQAIPRADRLLLLNNGCDSALRLYPHLDRCDRASALGYVGLSADSDAKVQQIDVCCMVGKKHEALRYFDNDSLVARMRPYLFLEPGQP